MVKEGQGLSALIPILSSIGTMLIGMKVAMLAKNLPMALIGAGMFTAGAIGTAISTNVASSNSTIGQKNYMQESIESRKQNYDILDDYLDKKKAGKATVDDDERAKEAYVNALQKLGQGNFDAESAADALNLLTSSAQGASKAMEELSIAEQKKQLEDAKVVFGVNSLNTSRSQKEQIRLMAEEQSRVLEDNPLGRVQEEWSALEQYRDWFASNENLSTFIDFFKALSESDYVSRWDSNGFDVKGIYSTLTSGLTASTSADDLNNLWETLVAAIGFIQALRNGDANALYDWTHVVGQATPKSGAADAKYVANSFFGVYGKEFDLAKGFKDRMREAIIERFKSDQSFDIDQFVADTYNTLANGSFPEWYNHNIEKLQKFKIDYITQLCLETLSIHRRIQMPLMLTVRYKLYSH